MAGVQQLEPWRLLPVALISFSLVKPCPTPCRVHSPPPCSSLAPADEANGHPASSSATDDRRILNDASSRYHTSAASPPICTPFAFNGTMYLDRIALQQPKPMLDAPCLLDTDASVTSWADLGSRPRDHTSSQRFALRTRIAQWTRRWARGTPLSAGVSLRR